MGVCNNKTAMNMKDVNVKNGHRVAWRLKFLLYFGEVFDCFLYVDH